MSTEVVIKAKEHLARWRREFLENSNEMKKFKINNHNELLEELITFQNSETDYIIRLAEANLKRVVASFDEEGKMDGLVYDFNDQYLVIYFDDDFYKWDTKTEIDDCYEFFIDRKSKNLN